MQTGIGILGRRQRLVAWVGFLALALYAPVVAYALPYGSYTVPDDTWMFSVTVAGLVAMVLIIDDVERRRARSAKSGTGSDLPSATTD